MHEVKKIFFKAAETEYYKKHIDILRKDFPNVEFSIGKSDEMLQKHLPDADGVVAGRFWPNELEIAKNLKALFIPFSGTDAFDIKLISSKGIIIANSHGASPYIAERAIGLAISLIGKICRFSNDLRKGYWHRSEFWTSIQELNIGIWGVGSIGREVAKKLSGFECKINGLSRTPKNKIEYFDHIYTDMDDFIADSDLFFITIPLNDENRGLIDVEILSKMKDKYLIHISRGIVVDETALFNAIKTNHLAGAALDCWYNYPRGKAQPVFPGNKPFHELGNIVLSPHACSHSESARAANIEMTRKNIEAYIKTGTPISIVDPKKCY